MGAVQSLADVSAWPADQRTCYVYTWSSPDMGYERSDHPGCDFNVPRDDIASATLTNPDRTGVTDPYVVYDFRAGRGPASADALGRSDTRLAFSTDQPVPPEARPRRYYIITRVPAADRDDIFPRFLHHEMLNVIANVLHKGNTCIACYQRPRCIRTECGHKVLCMHCLGNVDKCPICRMAINKDGLLNDDIVYLEETYLDLDADEYKKPTLVLDGPLGTRVVAPGRRRRRPISLSDSDNDSDIIEIRSRSPSPSSSSSNNSSSSLEDIEALIQRVSTNPGARRAGNRRRRQPTTTLSPARPPVPPEANMNEDNNDQSPSVPSNPPLDYTSDPPPDYTSDPPNTPPPLPPPAPTARNQLPPLSTTRTYPRSSASFFVQPPAPEQPTSSRVAALQNIVKMGLAGYVDNQLITPEAAREQLNADRLLNRSGGSGHTPPRSRQRLNEWSTSTRNQEDR